MNIFYCGAEPDPGSRVDALEQFDIVLIQKDGGFRPLEVLATPVSLPNRYRKVPTPASQQSEER